MIDFSLDLVTLFVVLLIVFLVTLLSYLSVSGLFTTVEVKTKEPSYGPMVIAYKTDTGPYRNAGELYTESYCLLPNKEQIGIYYDDPEAVPENELRYAVGPILGNADEPPSAMEMEKMRANGFKIAHFPKPNYAVCATFPFRTTLSIYMAIYKVYPKMKAYIAGKSLCAYPALEIYSDHDIVFMMPLSQQDEFFVREFQEEELSIATTDMGSVYNDHAEFTDTESRDSRTPLTEEVPRKDSAGFVIPLAPRKVSGLVVDSSKPCDTSLSLSVTEVARGERSRSPTREVRVSGGNKMIFGPGNLEGNQGGSFDAGDTTPDDESSEGTTSSFEDIGKDLEIEKAAENVEN